MGRNLKAARELLHLAKELVGRTNSDPAMMTQEDMLDFLYSQVQHVEIVVNLPDIGPDGKGTRQAVQKYPQPSKEEQNRQFLEEVEGEEAEVEQTNEQWKEIAKKIGSLPPDNGGVSFYKDIVVRVLKNRSFSVNLKRRSGNKTFRIDCPYDNPYDEWNKNNPFLYEGIDSINDFRDFLIRKFDSNEMHFDKCITEAYNVDFGIKMPLDVYDTEAVLKMTGEKVRVYVKFGIYNKGKCGRIELEFENFSFHPLKKKNSN